MATGLIFAGAGRYSFGNSNLAIASLCIAFFPRWPRHWDENRPYLQAYRHMWALAIEPHCLSTVDIDTLQTVYMPLGITALTGDGVETNTRVHISPTLVPDIDRVVTLHLASPRYMPHIVKFSWIRTPSLSDAGRHSSTTSMIRKATDLSAF
jgi:anaphase-promoting complex subunit 1